MASRTHQIQGSVRQRLGLALSRELQTGERVVWEGMKLARVEPAGFGIYLFAIPWTAFALFWTAMAAAGVSQSDEGWMVWAFPAFGIPFVLVGFGMLATPFVPYMQRGRILFAITNQRVLRLSLGRHLNIKSVPANRIGQVERSESPDGTGSLKLAIGVGRDSDGDRTTEHFNLGRVEEVMAASRAISDLTNS